MSRYKVTTPATPRMRLANGMSRSADFEQATECGSPVCVRHLIAKHEFAGCSVWRRKRNHWALIFDTSGPQGDYSNPAAVWARVEAAQ